MSEIQKKKNYNKRSEQKKRVNLQTIQDGNEVTTRKKRRKKEYRHDTKCINYCGFVFVIIAIILFVVIYTFFCIRTIMQNNFVNNLHFHFLFSFASIRRDKRKKPFIFCETIYKKKKNENKIDVLNAWCLSSVWL